MVGKSNQKSCHRVHFVEVHGGYILTAGLDTEDDEFCVGNLVRGGRNPRQVEDDEGWDDGDGGVGCTVVLCFKHSFYHKLVETFHINSECKTTIYFMRCFVHVFA